jgi:ArsR family transcriptional regulator
MERATVAAVETPAISAATIAGISERADDAAAFLKALAHSGRLRLLCHLAHGEKSVGELERLIGARQAAVSQQLARLREEGMVRTRRDGKTVYYALADGRVARTVALLHELFCRAGG